MQIRELSIDGFGIFGEQTVDGLAPGLNVFLGDNEAGKSTLLAFVRTLLFGFPDGRSKENPYPPLRGGSHGGRMVLESTGSDLFTVERHPGPRGGNVTLTCGPENSVYPEGIAEILGPTTRDLFRNVYAFSLSELQSFETLQGDRVKAALYGASAGTSVLALPRVQTELDNLLGGLYKPQGVNPLLNQKLNEYERLDAQLQAASGTVERYTDVSVRIESIGAELAELLKARSARQADLRERQALLRLWPSWLELLAIERRMAELPAEPSTAFPDNGINRLDILIERRAERRQTWMAAQQALEQLEEALGRYRIDPLLIDQISAARRLRDGAEAHVARLQIMEALEAKRNTTQRDLARLLEELGPDWTADDLRQIDRSLFAREEIRRFRTTFSTVREERLEAETVERTATEALERAREAEESPRSEVAALRDPGPAPEREALERLRRAREHATRVATELPELEAHAGGVRAELAKALEQLGPGWNAGRVMEADLSLARQTRLDELERHLEAAQLAYAEGRAAVRGCQERVEVESRARAVAEGELGRVAARDVTSRQELLDRRAALRILRRIVPDRIAVDADLRRESDRIAGLQREAARLPGAGILSGSALGIIGSIVLAIAGLIAALPLAAASGLVPRPDALPFALDATPLLAAPFALLGFVLVLIYLAQRRRLRSAEVDRRAAAARIAEEVSTGEATRVDLTARQAELARRIERSARLSEMAGWELHGKAATLATSGTGKLTSSTKHGWSTAGTESTKGILCPLVSGRWGWSSPDVRPSLRTGMGGTPRGPRP